MDASYASLPSDSAGLARATAAGLHQLHAGDYAAVVTTQGAALRSLTYQGRDLVVPSPAGQPIPDYRGVIAAPWPNRVADGLYSFDGEKLRLGVNEPERGCALHGLVFDREWSFSAAGKNSVTLSLELDPSRGYPFALHLEASYILDADCGLQWEVRARNTGNRAAPYGVCPHPYLVAGEAPLDDWELEVPASRFLEVTPDRLLPVRERHVGGDSFDFRSARPIGRLEIDHAFTGLGFDTDGTARVTIRDRANGSGVVMTWDAACCWLQIHTADKAAPAPSRVGLAVEPMTCPPDAFNSGTDLIVLAPGEEHTARWRINALAGAPDPTY
ncbi:aldose 1-epimerase family protein [Sinomonas sp. ASV322]|uniref:aldose 1-epimerase family protein n=1 Tax=Sinomonas sp. ASV322 TaxID=3041920 RepID=UPI0027DE8570|nr:aldose 1-epimerase family protein [Sinomonas sp. ASV322]MDQ4502368.1 aldose 1-epimerase family protein [Sinomonas sp. ASV322]